MTDFSTIDLEKLARRPLWEPKQHTARASEHPGQGCYLDPPGFPSYFLRAVYVGGHAPRSGATTIIRSPDGDRVVACVDSKPDHLLPRLRHLWRPLPLDHERTQLWIRGVYKHLQYSYRDDNSVVAEPSERGMVIWPVPSYKLRHFVDDKRFSEEWRTAERAAVEAYNVDIRERTALVATTENHSAVRRIRGFYPEHSPDMELIANPPATHGGDWWETEATRPSVEECRPRNGIGARDHETEWCQWCGRDPGQART